MGTVTAMKQNKSPNRSTAGLLKAGGIDVTKSDLLKVYPEDIVLITDPNHPLYDDRVDPNVCPLDLDLVKSITDLGVQHAVVVRRNGVDKNDRPILEVVSGIQRTRCAREVNQGKKGDDRIKIPICIMHGDDASLYEWKAQENAQRREETLFTRAKKAQRLLAFGRSRTRVVEVLRLGNVTTLDLHLDFLGLSPEAQQEFVTKNFPMTAIPVIASVPKAEQPAMIVEVKKLGARKGHEVKAAVDATRKGKAYVVPEQKKMVSRSFIEQWAAALPECEARAALLFVLGYSESLNNYPRLRLEDQATKKDK